MNFVMTPSKEQIQSLLDFYRHNVNMRGENHIVATIKDEFLTVTIYESNKVMFQGKDAEDAFFFWHDKFNLPSIEGEKKSHKNHNFYKPSIGSDESGVGDYFGPLTVCAVYLSKESMDYIATLGVDDSKVLSDKSILKIAPKLMKKVPYSLLVLNNKKYNDLIAKSYNANTLKAYLHAQAHKKLLEKIDAKEQPFIIVDQFCEEATYMNYLKQFKTPIKPNLFLTKAESHYASVAAASIIARYAFLINLAKLSEKLGVKLLKGASKSVDEQASALIKKSGMTALKNYAKVHFKTTEKAKAKLDSNNPTY